MARRDNLRLYITPRAGYSRTSSKTVTESTQSVTPNLLPGLTTAMPRREMSGKGDGWSFAGLFGAQYDASERFAVFGEVGAGYSSNQPGISTISDITSRSFGIRSGVGVIVFF